MNKPVFTTPYQSMPFSQFKAEDFKVAIEKAIAESLQNIDSIANFDGNPTFENTIEALAFNGEKLNRMAAAFYNLNSAQTDEDLQQVAREISPMLSEYSNDILLNENLFKRVKYVYQHTEKSLLLPEEKTLLEKTY